MALNTTHQKAICHTFKVQSNLTFRLQLNNSQQECFTKIDQRLVCFQKMLGFRLKYQCFSFAPKATDRADTHAG